VNSFTIFPLPTCSTNRHLSNTAPLLSYASAAVEGARVSDITSKCAPFSFSPLFLPSSFRVLVGTEPGRGPRPTTPFSPFPLWRAWRRRQICRPRRSFPSRISIATIERLPRKPTLLSSAELQRKGRTLFSALESAEWCWFSFFLAFTPGHLVTAITETAPALERELRPFPLPASAARPGRTHRGTSNRAFFFFTIPRVEGPI